MANGLIIGGPVYGEPYLTLFECYGLATMRSKANLAALRENGACLDLATDSASYDRLMHITRDCGFPVFVRVLPMHSDKYHAMEMVHSLFIREAIEYKRPFHMFVADEAYSVNYFPNLFTVAAKHGDVIHSGLNGDWEPVAAGLDAFRADDGSIAIPCEAMGDIVWRHLNSRFSQFVMNAAVFPDSMPNIHFQLWRARDRAMLFSPHNNVVYMTPETCRQVGSYRGTLDATAHKFIGRFYAPTLEDDMTMIALETSKAHEMGHVDWNQYAETCWNQMRGGAASIEYLKRPSTEVAMGLDEEMPTADEILARQCVIAERLLEHANG